MYIVYNVRSTMELARYQSLGWARRRANKMNNRNPAYRPEYMPAYDVATLEYYNTKVVGMKTVRNLMTGEEVSIPTNTPRSCDPSSELYHSM